jgi:hypothetical protein
MAIDPVKDKLVGIVVSDDYFEDVDEIVLNSIQGPLKRILIYLDSVKDDLIK